MMLSDRYRSLIRAWRMQRVYTRSLESLRASSPALGLPLHRMSPTEVDAAIASFAWFARARGMSTKDVAEVVRTVRETYARTRQRHEDLTL